MILDRRLFVLSLDFDERQIFSFVDSALSPLLPQVHVVGEEAK